MKYHTCSKCAEKFPVTSKVRVWNTPSYLFYPFHGSKKQFDLFSYVRCPTCGHEENDPSIKFLWLLPPSGMLWLFLAFLIIAILDAIYN